MPIQLLDNSMINKIAAGEVVERPLSVVKELAENAADAGAKNITIEIKDGGISYIRVTDNGCGIPKDELKTAFLRHATSKIRSYDDLVNVMTMGFRGEALSSIAAVTQLEMVSKTDGATEGARIEINGGQIVRLSDAAAVTGTTIITRNLFFNTPARRKFLKKPQTEAALIHELAGRLALSRPEIAYKYINNNQNVFSTNGGGDLKTTAFYVYGKEISGNIIEIPEEGAEIKLKGFVCAPAYARGNRSYGNFFINGRYIKNAVVQSAVEDAYKNRLAAGKFPVYVLHMTITPARVDINVHPQKQEARFDDEDAVYSAVYSAVKDALEKEGKPSAGGRNALYTTVSWNGGENTRAAEVCSSAGENEEPYKINNTEEDYFGGGVARIKPLEPIAEPTVARVDSLTGAAPQAAQTTTEHREKGLTLDGEAQSGAKGLFAGARVVGQAFGTYFILEKGGELLLLDQHAAHERVLFEEYTAKLKNGKAPSQMLLAGEEITLSPVAADTVTRNADLLSALGFELERRGKGGNTFVLTAMPYIFDSPVNADFFADIADGISSSPGKGGERLTEHSGSGSDAERQGAEERSLYDYKANAVAAIACKAAVKGNRTLGGDECEQLLKRLEKSENPYTCPHGRPTFISMSLYEIEKRFGRRG